MIETDNSIELRNYLVSRSFESALARRIWRPFEETRLKKGLFSFAWLVFDGFAY